MTENSSNTDRIQASRIKKLWIYALIILIAIAVCYFCFGKNSVVSDIMAVMTPIFFGIAIAYILNPVTIFFEKIYAFVAVKIFKIKHEKYKNRANILAIILSLIVLLLLLWILISSVIPQLYNTIMSLINYIPDGFDKLNEWYDQLVQNENTWLASIGISVDKILENAEAWFTENLPRAVNSALQYITSGVMSAVSFVFNLIIGVCVAIYLLREKNKIFAHLKKITYAVFDKYRADGIIKMGIHAKNIFNGYLYGTLVGCIIVFVATFAFMLLMGMPYVVLISTIVCVTNFIPFFGPFIGAVPSILILLLYDPMMALWFGIFTLALQQIEGHFLTPLIISNTTDVSPFWVTAALLVGGGCFGLGGLIFSVPVFSVIYYIVKVYVERRLENKGLSCATDEYVNDNDFNIQNLFNRSKGKNKEKQKNKSNTDK